MANEVKGRMAVERACVQVYEQRREEWGATQGTVAGRVTPLPSCGLAGQGMTWSKWVLHCRRRFQWKEGKE